MDEQTPEPDKVREEADEPIAGKLPGEGEQNVEQKIGETGSSDPAAEATGDGPTGGAPTGGGVSGDGEAIGAGPSGGADTGGGDAGGGEATGSGPSGGAE